MDNLKIDVIQRKVLVAATTNTLQDCIHLKQSHTSNFNRCSIKKPRKLSFNRDLLPSPSAYYRSQGLTLKGGGEWKSAICPFHKDTQPSLRVRIDNGVFKCMACGAHGGDVLAFHMQRYNLSFYDAVSQLNAWEK